MEWGGDQEVLLTLYRSLVRSKLDYGSIMYGAARKSYLLKLDPIANQGLRLSLGALRTSPSVSLHAEAQELPLHLRRQKLSMQYALRVSTNSQNPTYSTIFFDGKLRALFQKVQESLLLFILGSDRYRIKSISTSKTWTTINKRYRRTK